MKAYQQIQLTPEQRAETLKWREKDPLESQKRCIDQKKIRLYIAQTLKRNDEKSRSSYRMCYTQGSDVYSRQDGLPITQDDLDSLNDIEIGQENRVNGKVGDVEVTHSWAIDSSD